jgi:transposase-like protein
MWPTRRMNTPGAANPSKRHRFPAEIIRHGVWLSCRFCLSCRDVEERMPVRGVIVSYDAIRQWCRAFGQSYANYRRRRPRPGDTWHLGAAFLPINGPRHDLREMTQRFQSWRAITGTPIAAEDKSAVPSAPSLP